MSVFLAPSDDRNVVNLVHVTSIIAVDSSSVIFEGLWDGDSTSNWTSLVNLLHHCVLASDSAKLINSIDQVLVWHEACLARVAVSTDVHG